MNYVNPPPPGDDEIIFTDSEGIAYTWGQHREMERTLDELEKQDTDVKSARVRLENTLAKYGIRANAPVIKVCEFCGTNEYATHKTSCVDYLKDLPVTREAGAYKYLSDKFEVVHQTSAPLNDDEALGYFGIVQLMFQRDPDLWVRYILRRNLHEDEFKMMPWEFNKDVWEVLPIVRKS